MSYSGPFYAIYLHGSLYTNFNEVFWKYGVTVFHTTMFSVNELNFMISQQLIKNVYLQEKSSHVCFFMAAEI